MFAEILAADLGFRGSLGQEKRGLAEFGEYVEAASLPRMRTASESVKIKPRSSNWCTARWFAAPSAVLLGRPVCIGNACV
jgi:hypothetical protein